MIQMTRRYRFSASHRLHTDALPEGENEAIYGKCNNPYGHGHDYVLEVTVEGPLDASTGQVIPVATLDGIVAQYVLRDFEHKNLNEDVPDFAGRVPTSENVACAIEERLQRAWKLEAPEKGPRLKRVWLRETQRNSFELSA